jgi:23S rRNA pseudouridine1911/1915/1917 synthase
VGSAARAKDEAALPPYGIQHEDDDILVVEKPAGLLTAPTPEGDRNTLASQLGKRFGPVFVVHRLDLGTSGLLVFARTAEANRALSERFRTHDLDREYLAVLGGRLEQDAYTVTEPVQGKRALTHITVVERIGSVATVARCRLETGRTHQIRLHTMHLGHPVLGDARYGTRTPIEPPRMALHATTLGFIHPRTGLSVRFEAPLPSDLEAWVRTLGETPGAPLFTP